MSNLFEIDRSRKQEKPIRCPHCATTFIIRNGTYPRAHPEKSGQIAVQRYRCKSPDCPWKTFSVLPYPFLPTIRHFYKTLFICHCLFNVHKRTQADTARQLCLTRGIVKRFGGFCRRFIAWFNREKVFADWGADPRAHPTAFWRDFTRDFSQAFYPGRWLRTSPTQHIPTGFQ